jgi:two-component system, NtrC family, response regulator AtoC
MIETADLRPRSPAASEDRLYLLVVHGHASTAFPLSRDGSVTIGRAPTSDITVDDPSVSRQHARVTTADGRARVLDLDSHNGVRLNGHPIAGWHPLHGGDVIALGNATLVFHRGARAVTQSPLLGAEAFRARVAQELDRIRSRDGAVSILAIELGGPRPQREELLTALSEPLRLMDVAGDVAGALLVMLPELGPGEAAAVGADLLERLRPRAPAARGGLSSAPGDGLDVGALIALAREAAAMAGPAQVSRSEPSSYRLEIGDRWVLVADPSTKANYDLLRRLARSDLSVLIHGETGVGKENAARAVHFWSARRANPFLALNCSTLSETLAESVLFGHAKGAFTDAKAARPGLFESASGGTVFLDEVGELPLTLQPKLLRVLEEKSVVRVGESAEIEVDVRIVAATNRNLDEQVEAGTFRKDLLFRLNAGKVTLAPLRDRRRELPLLARAFLAEECANLGYAPFELSAAAMGALGSHPWPGNVRELMNAMKFAAVAAAPGPIVDAGHLPQGISGATHEPPPPASRPGRERAFQSLRAEIQELERTRMAEALEAAGGVQAHAAQLIGMPIRTFMSKVKLYRLGRPR